MYIYIYIFSTNHHRSMGLSFLCFWGCTNSKFFFLSRSQACPMSYSRLWWHPGGRRFLQGKLQRINDLITMLSLLQCMIQNMKETHDFKTGLSVLILIILFIVGILAKMSCTSIHNWSECFHLYNSEITKLRMIIIKPLKWNFPSSITIINPTYGILMKYLWRMYV